MKKLLIFIIPLLLLGACNNKKSAHIKGNYPGEGHKYLYIDRIDINIPVPIDSIKINKAGNFSIKLESDQAEFYTIGFSDTEFVTVLSHPGDKIELQFTDENRLQNAYSIKGSEESDKIRLLDIKLGETLNKLDSLRQNYYDANNAEEGGDEAAAIEQVYLEIIKQQRKDNIAFILDNLHNFSAIKALYQTYDDNTYVLYEVKDLQYLKLVSDTLNKHYPDSRLSNSLEKNLQQGLNQMYVDNLNATIDMAEPVKLEISLPDTEGNRVPLSSLRDNYVLLSFWVTGSKECISNNLQMKQIHSRYHSKGFEIYQVNLDEDEERWKNLIRYDELPWISVIEDNESGTTAAALFNVSQVPTNYLFDKQGEIIGKDLFGRDLQIKLSQLFD